MLASTPVALALALLTGTPLAAELPPLSECQAVQERIQLSPEPAGNLHTVCISPGLVTSLLLDEQLPSGTVELEAKEHEVLVAQAGRVVTLVPAGNLMPGRRFNMAVHFRDGAAPVSASFVLVVHPAWGQRQVEVFRRKRTVESYQQALKEKESEAQLCHEENAQLRQAQGRPDGLRGLRSAGLMGQGGIAFRALGESTTQRPGSVLSARNAMAYRSRARVAVELRLELTAPAGSETWEAGGAALIGPGGRVVPVLEVWQETPVTPGKGMSVVMVEAEALPDEAQGTFTLKLWDAGGARTLTLDGVTFPPLQVATSPRE